RLNDAVIRLPSLRERREDIPDLVRHFLHRHGGELTDTQPTITKDCLPLLQHRSWPGNVRELQNIVHKAVMLAHGDRVDPEVLRKVLGETSLAQPETNLTLQAYVTDLLES